MLEPFGQPRTDSVLATLGAHILNKLRFSEEDPGVSDPSSLLPIIAERAHRNPQQELKADLAWIDAQVAAGNIIDLTAEREKRKQQ